MHKDIKTSSSGSTSRTKGSCCGDGARTTTDPVKPSVVPQQFTKERRAAATPEATQGKSGGCCCSG